MTGGVCWQKDGDASSLPLLQLTCCELTQPGHTGPSRTAAFGEMTTTQALSNWLCFCAAKQAVDFIDHWKGISPRLASLSQYYLNHQGFDFPFTCLPILQFVFISVTFAVLTVRGSAVRNETCKWMSTSWFHFKTWMLFHSFMLVI